MIDLTTAPATIRGNAQRRSVRATWVGDTDANGKTFVVELSVHHDGNRKAFRAYLTRALESSSNGFTIREHQPFRDVVALPVTPVARYSKKGLMAAFAAALTHTHENAANIAASGMLVMPA